MPAEVFFIPMLILMFFFIIEIGSRMGHLKNGLSTQWSAEKLGPTLRRIGPLFGAMLVLFVMMVAFGE